MKLRAIKGFGIAGAVLVLVGGLVWAGLKYREGDSRTWGYWQRRLPQELAAARAAGIATSWDEVKEPTPKGVNGASLIDAAHATFDASGFKPAHHSWSGMYTKGGKERRESVREVRRFERQIPAILAATGADHFDWDVDPSRYYEGTHRAGQLTSALTTAAAILAMEGESRYVKAAFLANQSVRRRLGTMGTERTLTWHGILRERAAASLAQMAGSPDVRAELVAELAETLDDPAIPLKEGLRFEAIARRNQFESGRHSDWMQSDVEFRDAVDPLFFLEWKTFYQAPESALRESYSAVMLSRFTKSWSELDRPAVELARAGAAEDMGVLERDKPLPIDYFFLEQSVEQWVGWRVLQEAKTNLLEAAVHIHLFKRKHKEWPANLGRVEGVPLDPWSGEPFRYQRHKDRFYVWSVGPNGKNDWGHSPNDSPPGDDVCFSSRAGVVLR